MMVFCLFLFFAGGSLSASYDIDPFQVLIQDVQVVANISGAIMKGIPAKIGSPPQQVALLPWAELNNTYAYDAPGYCDETVIFSDTICLVRRGNLFSEDDSTSLNSSLDIAEAGGALVETHDPNAEKGIPKLVSSSLAGTDDFQLGSSGTLNKFPIGIPRLAWDSGYSIMHPLGLGRNSTYLNAMLASGRVGSRVWSIFSGRMWTEQNPIDGAIVFGGYDKRKVIGANHTQALDYSSSGCWTGMKVTISDIKVNRGDGTDQSLFSPNISLQCCIVPQRQLLMEIPVALYDNFENVTNTASTESSFGIHWSAHVYDEGGAFGGDITIQLDSGLEIRIANDQYIVPQVFVERNGTRIISNDGKREVLIRSIGTEPATLGRYFLTGAYLMVNHEVGSFTIWQANPASSSELVAVLDQKSADACTDKTLVVQPSRARTSSPVGKPFIIEGPSTSNSSLVAVAVVGSLIFIVAVAGLFICLRRRLRIKARARAGTRDSSAADAMNPRAFELQGSNGSELPGCQEFELQGSQGLLPELQDSQHELHEMPAHKQTTVSFYH